MCINKLQQACVLTLSNSLSEEHNKAKHPVEQPAILLLEEYNLNREREPDEGTY